MRLSQNIDSAYNPQYGKEFTARNSHSVDLLTTIFLGKYAFLQHHRTEAIERCNLSASCYLQIAHCLQFSMQPTAKLHIWHMCSFAKYVSSCCILLVLGTSCWLLHQHNLPLILLTLEKAQTRLEKDETNLHLITHQHSFPFKSQSVALGLWHKCIHVLK
jgi:hypothetical protein